MASLDPALTPILIRIADADGGAGHRFAPMFIATNPGPIAIAPYVQDPQDLLPKPMQALAGLGYLALEEPAPGKGGYGPFQLTDAGRQAAKEAAAAEAAGQTAEQRAADERTLRRFLTALGAAAEATGDAGDQARLQRIAESAEGVAPSVIADVIRDAVAASKG
ncbi:hypothetical protein [Patulibacter minatonensis]|uniref:hypothetical protein n=1 Tax=Patulibacter minatonensis TaxID=298163 RepID=UPI00047CD2D7|nr:hypothetical protein [Patulibacter minatonensis]